LTTVEKTVGASNVIDVTMQESAEALEEVVVTALEFPERKNHWLCFSIVAGDDVSNVKSETFANALSGKVAGFRLRETPTWVVLPTL